VTIILIEFSNIKNTKIVQVIQKEQTNWIKFKENFETLSFNSIIATMTNPNKIAEELSRITDEAIKTSTKNIRLRCNKDVRICKWFIVKAIKHQMCRLKPGNVTYKL